MIQKLEREKKNIAASWRRISNVSRCLFCWGRWKCGSGKCGSRWQGYCDRRIEQIMLLC